VPRQLASVSRLFNRIAISDGLDQPFEELVVSISGSFWVGGPIIIAPYLDKISMSPTFLSGDFFVFPPPKAD
jgi:hypothetical protein